MDRRNSDVNVLFSSGGFFTVESVNGVTTVSLHHFPSLPSTMEADGIERPGMNPKCVPAVSVHTPFPISGQRELGSDNRQGGSLNEQNELNSEVPLIDGRELSRRDIYLPQYNADRISQQGTAFQEQENQVLQPKSRKRSSDTLQLESTKKLKQNSLKSESLGWCSLCEIDCIKEVFLKHHILGKTHKRMLKKLKKRDIIGNSEKNEKQVEEVGICQKKHKGSSITHQQAVECKTCDKVFISQDSFESHVAQKKHAKQPEIMESSKAFPRVNDYSKECAFADGINTMSGLATKKAKNQHVQRAKDDYNSDATSEEFENAELKEQQQMKGAGIPPKKHNMPTKLQKFSKKECEICDVLVFNQGDFESRIAGRKHAKMLKISEFSESLLKSKDNSKDHVDKTAENKTILEFKHDRGSRAHNEKDDLKEFV